MLSFDRLQHFFEKMKWMLNFNIQCCVIITLIEGQSHISHRQLKILDSTFGRMKKMFLCLQLEYWWSFPTILFVKEQESLTNKPFISGCYQANMRNLSVNVSKGPGRRCTGLSWALSHTLEAGTSDCEDCEDSLHDKKREEWYACYGDTIAAYHCIALYSTDLYTERGNLDFNSHDFCFLSFIEKEKMRFIHLYILNFLDLQGSTNRI